LKFQDNWDSCLSSSICL